MSPILILLVSALIPLAAVAQAQSASEQDKNRQEQEAKPPPPPAAMQNQVNVRVLQYHDKPFPLLHTAQIGDPFPIDSVHPAFNAHNRFTYYGESFYLEEPALSTPLSPNLNTTLAGSLQTLTVRTGFAPSVLTGNPRSDPIITKPTTTTTKPAILGGSSSDEAEDSSSTPLFGPEIDVPLKGDLTEWPATEWLSEGTSLHLYARALFGSFEVFDVESDLQLYSVGPRVLVPLIAVPEFSLGGSISAGAAFLRTDIGDAVGFEATGGLRAQVPLLGGLAFVADLGYGFFTAEHVYSWGPSLNMGLVLSW